MRIAAVYLLEANYSIFVISQSSFTRWVKRSLGCPVLITITCTKIGLIVNGGLFTSVNLGCDFSIHNTTSCFYFAFMASIKIQCPVHHNHRD